MEFSVNMQPELMLDPLWIIIGGIAFAASLVFFVLLFVFKMKPRKKRPKKVKPPKKLSDAMIRQKTLMAIDRLIFELSHNKTDVRESYQSLSTIMRSFVSELTGRDVTTCTLTDLQASDQKQLAELISRWYAPEFAMKTQANFIEDAKKTRRLVKSWN